MSKFVFTAAIFVSAFLLFLVQPMFARMALPFLGGAPSVWNTALVFYQATLLLGYLWAHWVSKSGKTGPWIWIHGAVLVFAALMLPIRLPAMGAPPSTGSPVPWLLGLLALGVGLPFFAVSTTSPLIQRWFSRIGHKESESPYFLYAASNIGSLAALLGYPLFFERLMTLKDQSVFWTVGFALLIILTAWCAVLFRRAPEASAEELVSVETLDWKRKARWVALAFVPSSLLMGLTTYISTEIAAVPLLWVVPLAIYLLTFILTFANRKLIPHKAVKAIAPFFLALPLVVTIGNFHEIKEPQFLAPLGPLLVIIAGFGGFFVCSMLCHGELSEDKPGVTHLTEFFLWVSLGGVLGGLFCGLISPVVFKQVLEYPIALVLCAALTRYAVKRNLTWDIVLPGLTLAASVLGLVWLRRTDNWSEFSTWKAMVAPAVLAALSFGSPVRFATSVAILAGVPLFFGPITTNRDYQSRSFFGTIVVRSNGFYTTLSHGTTLHGEQFSSPLFKQEPVSYYHRTGPIGDVIEKRKLPQDAHVAVVGLGVGTLMAYAHPGQTWTIYEIDPEVVKVAENPHYFTYLSDHKGLYSIVLGDARLSLSHTQEKYDLVVLDAYSSDAVPVHLITQEAFATYASVLRPGGLIAVHISNRYMELWPVVLSAAEHIGFIERRRRDGDIAQYQPYKNASNWVLLAPTKSDLGVLATDPDWESDTMPNGFVPWTDQRSTILEVLKASPFNKVPHG